MPILLFTIVFCFIFILMTYARLENFLNFSIIRSQFKEYIQSMEREYSNIKTMKIYTDIKLADYNVASSESANDDNKNQKEKQLKLSSMLSIKPLLDETIKNSNHARYQQTRQTLQALIEELYRPQPFYREFEKTHPNFVPQLLDRMEAAAKSLPQGTKLYDTAEINSLELQDPEYNELLYKILKGTQDPNADVKNRARLGHKYDHYGNIKESKDEGDVVIDSNSYDTLLDYITLDKEAKVNMYLASRSLLRALFLNPTTVEDVIKFRKEAYASSNKVVAAQDKKNLSEDFKSRFYGLLKPGIDDSLVVFEVTGTDPTKYE